jgi:dTDP-D-glucose 4,6-dehydratase
VLDWEPSISFKEGLRRSIEWYYATKDVAEVASRIGVLLTER